MFFFYIIKHQTAQTAQTARTALEVMGKGQNYENKNIKS